MQSCETNVEPMSYYINSGLPWSTEENENLKKEYVNDKLDIFQISKLHKRTPGGIASRIVTLKLENNFSNIDGYELYQKSKLYQEVINRHCRGISPLKSKKIVITKIKGYIYCMSNPSMPGIVKIGMTSRSPKDRLNDANKHDTFKPPTPYYINFAKQVSNPKIKEGLIHELLSRYTERVNPQREFFRVTLAEVQKFFELVDGVWWIDKDDSQEIESEETD
jgi:hypothetical protein